MPMLDPGSNRELPTIPAKRYFSIGEVAGLCDVKQHVLRYWETEFPQSGTSQTPWQPPLLPAPRCPVSASNSQPVV